MNLSKLKHLIKPSPNEKLSDALTRQIGFLGVAVVEIILNVNFFQSLGESWVMPFAGAVLVFMEVWHWISAQSASGVRRAFHYTAWLAIALTSIVAIVSFGQAITSVSSDDVARAAVVQTNQDAVRQSLFDTAQRDLASAEAEIADLLADKADLTKYDARSRVAIDESLRLAEAKKTDATARMERYSGLSVVAETPTATGGAISAESVKKSVSARIIFGQIFTDKYADTAIMAFFILFGIAMELTLSLASMPPNKDKKKKKIGLFALIRQFLATKQARLEALARTSQVTGPQQPLVIMTPQYQAPAPAPMADEASVPIRKKRPKPAPVIEEFEEDEPTVEAEVPDPVEFTAGERLAEKGLSSNTEDYVSLAEKKAEPEEPKSEIHQQLEEIAKADVEPIVDKAATLPLKTQESETAFLYVNNDIPLKALDAAEKGGFISNLQTIFNEFKRNGEKELSIKELSDKTSIPIVEIRRMFKFFFNRNLLTYDDLSRRWKFKLNKDNIINYLRDKQIQY